MFDIYQQKTGRINNAPNFTTLEAAKKWIRQNTTYFENGEILAIVSHKELKCEFVEMRLKMEMFEVKNAN